MAKIRFVGADGTETTVEAAAGASIMQAAVSQGVPGIVGECGGSLMCSTCHVYIDDQEDLGIVAVDDEEDEMLDAAAAERRETSRLACQIRPSGDTELVVHVPETQY
ncbi:2Fe-2S iron-sulfur cluster-binding protein [Pseudonocardia lutea]|uniref:2Fe-2S iron-sulfur cluster-binding protein n=1 Tax=Pseudonocardia lutea TaxID=2172015 RepID=A0ABW1I3H9_9PSEU